MNQAAQIKLFRNGSEALAEESDERPAELQAELVPNESRRVNFRTRGLIGLLVIAALACEVFFAPRVPLDQWPALLTLIAIAIIYERAGIQIYDKTHLSAGVVALFAISILAGPSGAVIAAPIVAFAAEVFTYSRWHARVFDMADYVLANVAGAAVFLAIAGTGNEVNVWWIPAAAAAVAVNYVITSGLVAITGSLEHGEKLVPLWREKYSWIFPYYLVFGLLGAALAAAYLGLGVTGILAFAAPPFMMRFAFSQYVSKTEQTVLELKEKNAELESANRNILGMTRQLTETYDGTLEALVLALDARDHETKGHSFRVAQYVMTMAKHMGVEPDTRDWVDMQRGALLHDVGKIGVPDHILHKPGPLTPEEWNDMKRHPHIGHEMLKEISFLSGAANIVHSHHERFDGKGYPRGMFGDEIPLGARVFAVADAFDAMTSDRPYRRALTAEMAREEIVRHSGTQFDPDVVQAFLLVYETIARHALSNEHRDDHAKAA
jgi:putative nucleotidyltransferase with HDIG domain